MTKTIGAHVIALDAPRESSSKRYRNSVLLVPLVLSLILLGNVSILALWTRAITLWVYDPLRSLGAGLLVAACVGILAKWKQTGWIMDGSLWGLVPVLVAILFAHVLGNEASPVVYGDYIGLSLGTTLFLYGVGTAWLFAGPRFVRFAIAPLLLLFLINPVPEAFNRAVDLPLQHIAAGTARHFAHWIGLQPTGQQLRLMFTPDFGMLIVPGCDGVRGAITVAYLALIFGYIKRLRIPVLALVSLAALLLGYALNLLRLCFLVGYYKLGLSVPSIQPYGTGVDYGIGCSLFLAAALLLGWLIAKQGTGKTPSTEALPLHPSWGQHPSPYLALRAASYAALTLGFGMASLSSGLPATWHIPNGNASLQTLPATVGPYRLESSFAEQNRNGITVILIGRYVAPGTSQAAPRELTMGLWIGMSHHTVAASEEAHGRIPKETFTFDAQTSAQRPARFVANVYQDDIGTRFDAETICSIDGCREAYRSRSAVWQPTKLAALLFSQPTRLLPVFLRREWPADSPTQMTAQKDAFERDSQAFLQQLDLSLLLKQDGSPD